MDSDEVMTSDTDTSSETAISENLGHACPLISDVLHFFYQFYLVNDFQHLQEYQDLVRRFGLTYLSKIEGEFVENQRETHLVVN